MPDRNDRSPLGDDSETDAEDVVGKTNRRVLVVDDDEALRILARASLTASGFDVIEAADGAEALEIIMASPPDLVVLDVDMPRMDGFDVCRSVRARSETRELPVLMMTGLQDTESITRAYDVGATDFVTKPPNWIVLAQRVRYMIRASAARVALAASESRLIEAQRVARVGWWETPNGGDEILTSNGFCEMFGLAPDNPLRSVRALAQLIHPEDRESVAAQIALARKESGQSETEFRIASGDGYRFAHQAIYSSRTSGNRGQRLLATVQDITLRKRHESQIHYLAHYDSLTGLPNRRLLERQLKRLLDENRGTGAHMAVLFADLDHFKNINDSFGHKAGDTVLREIADRLLASVRENDVVARSGGAGPVVARLGGDEFVVVLNRIRHAEDAARVAQRLVEFFRKPLQIEGRDIIVTASVGISVFPGDSVSSTELISCADAALYCAKGQGRDRYAFYTKALNDRARERLLLESSLRRAVEKNEWQIYYQPIVDSSNGSVISAEALVRWNHPQKGIVPPSVFIPIMEETGMIEDIGQWVLRQACQDCLEWNRLGFAGVRVAVNFSPRQFNRDGMDEEIRRVIAAVSIDPKLLVVELTETSVMADVEASIRRLHLLREVGVTLAIDDFGVGYSSLSLLRRLPIHELKIDRSFIRNVPDDEDNVAITSAVVGLAQSFRLSVVAEGVENSKQHAFLGTLGCDQLQGFGIARPMPFDSLIQFLEKSRRLVGSAEAD